jgi:hypothetical protein
VELRRSLIEDSREFGIALLDTSGVVENSIVRRSEPSLSDATFGDGVALTSSQDQAVVSIVGTIISDSARAGIANFGSNVSLEGSWITCAAFALTGQAYEGYDGVLDDRGDNLCGCPEPTEPCKLVTQELEPPSPL